MWFLKKQSDGSTKCIISENKSYTLGRKSTDIVLEDASISRKHCTIHIAKQSECPFPVTTSTGVWIVDGESKYGTYINKNNEWLRFNPGQAVKVVNGSIVRFGLMENVWSFEYKPLIVCVSGIPTDQKKKIESTLSSIDGFFRSAWCKECSLVLVNEITLTVKVVLALIHGVPIATPNYLQKVAECVKAQVELPKIEDYRPEVKEILLDKSLVSLNVKEERRQLFKGKTFIIPTKKQLETLKEIIVSAGGSVELLSHTKKNWERLAGNNIIMIQLPFNKTGIPPELIKSVQEITCFLKNRHGIRVIPESEIAQAVAYSSIEKFCNPKNDWFVLKVGDRKEVDLGPVIVEETPSIMEEEKNSERGVILCSLTMESELLVNTNPELSSPSHNLKQEGLSERKRTHSPNQLDDEFQNKKIRNDKNANIDDKKNSEDFSSPENETMENNSNKAANQSQKPPGVTNCFQKQTNKRREENIRKQSIKDFWNSEYLNAKSLKRRTSTESTDSSGSVTKRIKLPESISSKQVTPEFETDSPRGVVEVMVENEIREKSFFFPPIKKIRKDIDKTDFTEFFGKQETTDAVEDLNNTVFSLTLISPAFLREDGSLIDPPSEPINVKRFRKQKIIPPMILETEEKILQGDWIEPHCGRHNISVTD